MQAHLTRYQMRQPRLATGMTIPGMTQQTKVKVLSKGGSGATRRERGRQGGREGAPGDATDSEGSGVLSNNTATTAAEGNIKKREREKESQRGTEACCGRNGERRSSPRGQARRGARGFGAEDSDSKDAGRSKKTKKKPAGGLRWLHRKSKEEWTAAADGYRRLLCAFCKGHATRRR